MNLKLNSWHVWLWNYTYSDTVPNNLCPYFWKLVVAILLFIPNIVLRIPIHVADLFIKEKYNKFNTNNGRTGISILLYIAVTAVLIIVLSEYNWVKWLFNAYSYDNIFAAIGGLANCVAMFLLIRYFWLERNVGGKIKETTSNNIIVNFTKAWYNNHCPKINWEENPECGPRIN